MKLIIDAYNVLHAWRSGPMPDGPKELNALGAMIARSRFHGADTTIVCDGTPTRPAPTPPNASVHIRFAGPGKDADTLIESMVLKHKGPTLHVVSSDRRVQRAARKRRGTALTADAFLATIVRDAGGRSALNPAARLPKPDFATDLPLHAIHVSHWAAELDIALDAAGPASHLPAAPRQTHAHKTPPAPTPSPGSMPSQPDAGPASRAEPPAHDPLIAEALRHFKDRIAPEDLDMSRWI